MSTTRLNKAEDRESPCFTPDSTLISSAYSLFIPTLALVLITVNSYQSYFVGTVYCAQHSIILFTYRVKVLYIINKYITLIYIMFITLLKNFSNYKYIIDGSYI
jgi:hypothetical protein